MHVLDRKGGINTTIFYSEKALSMTNKSTDIHEICLVVFDSMSHKRTIRLVLCSGPNMGDAILKCQTTARRAECGVVLRCMKSACNKGSSE